MHRVLITAVMLAAKFFDDQYFNNLYYAKVWMSRVSCPLLSLSVLLRLRISERASGREAPLHLVIRRGID